ncbi:MAG: hypothetical protein WDW38_011564 [Sanguina aurantia]
MQAVCCILVGFTFSYTDLYKHLMNKTQAQREDKEAGRRSSGGGKATVQLGAGRGLTPPPDIFATTLRQQTLTVLYAIGCALTFFKFWYTLMLVTASLAAFFVSPFFLVVHFTIYFLDFDSGRTLVEAMTRSGLNIINTFVLGVLAIYVCAVITFLAFRDPLIEGESAPHCTTFYQCLGIHFVAGLQGNIIPIFSDPLQAVPEEFNYDSLIQSRTFFTVMFYILWVFVLQNIFVGVIASAFEAIRDDQNTVATDSQSKCLVCSLDMYTVDEHVPGGFDSHVNDEHNVLQYVYFLHHLRATDEEDYSGAESAVARTIHNLKTSTAKGAWLPANRSLAYQYALELEKGATQ